MKTPDMKIIDKTIANLKAILASDEQSAKASKPITAVLTGRIILVRDEQPLKALRPLLTSLVGISTAFSDLQPSNVDSSMSPILSESFTPSREKQLAKALNSRRTQESGIVTSERLKQKEKADAPII